jgi:hypothetical protein
VNRGRVARRRFSEPRPAWIGAPGSHVSCMRSLLRFEKITFSLCPTANPSRTQPVRLSPGGDRFWARANIHYSRLSNRPDHSCWHPSRIPATSCKVARIEDIGLVGVRLLTGRGASRLPNALERQTLTPPERPHVDRDPSAWAAPPSPQRHRRSLERAPCQLADVARVSCELWIEPFCLNVTPEA